MLYLEDYLEMIEHLPTELRDRFTDLREMDLSVQNKADRLEERQAQFFQNCSNKKPGRDEEYEKIRKEYDSIIGESSEKISMAEDSYNLVDKYLRKLDQELLKFKLELEADNRGITEVLEKRSLEMDAPTAGSSSGVGSGLKENRQPKKSSSSSLKRPNQTIAHGNATQKRKSSYLYDYDTPTAGGSSLSHTPSGSQTPLHTSSSSSMFLTQMGGSGSAIADAASAAIAATQQLVPGRRSSSMKASYEAISLGMQKNDFMISRNVGGESSNLGGSSSSGGAGPSSSMNPATPSTSSGIQDGPPAKRQKKAKQNLDMLDVSGAGLEDALAGLDPTAGDLGNLNTDELFDGGMGMPTGAEGGGDDYAYDPAEPRYCICNQVSYGDMVACDNEECPYEWFHYPCVGIDAPPKGKWYCPSCSARRKGRK